MTIVLTCIYIAWFLYGNDVDRWKLRNTMMDRYVLKSLMLWVMCSTL